MELYPYWLSFKLALITTLILVIIAIPLAYYLAYSKHKAKFIIEALCTLPLVLPPTVLGYYLLITFSPNQGLGAWLKQHLDWQIAFSFSGLIIGSIIYSLPFMLQPIIHGFTQLPKTYQEASYTLGKSKSHTFFKILIPCCKPAIITGCILSFAHTLGEFGVVLMLGGHLKSTKVISIAIYDEVQLMNYSQANQYALSLLIFSFITLIAANLLKAYHVKN